MKNEEKPTQKASESLSDADLDNIAGGGGPAVAAKPVTANLVQSRVAVAASPISNPVAKRP